MSLGVLRSIWGVTKVVSIFLFYAAELVVLRPRTRQARAKWLHRFCGTLRRSMHVRVTVEGGRFPHGGGAVISNHLGYADIIVYAATHECVFCAKQEIRKWPGVGWMTMMAGTVFIDRGRGGSAVGANSRMQATVEAGLPVMFFPEGTTTNGAGLLPFHSGLLQQALAMDAPITAARVWYTLDEPNAPGVTVENDVHYWGTINILKHLFRFCSLKGVHAHIRIADGPIEFSVPGINRKVAAVEAREQMLKLGVDAAAQDGSRVPLH